MIINTRKLLLRDHEAAFRRTFTDTFSPWTLHQNPGAGDNLKRDSGSLEMGITDRQWQPPSKVGAISLAPMDTIAKATLLEPNQTALGLKK